MTAKAPQCNGLCLRASDVLEPEDMHNFNGNPVARAHRTCPLHGDPETLMQELLVEVERLRDAEAGVGMAIAKYSAAKERAEKAERDRDEAQRHRDQAENRAGLYREQVRSEHDRAEQAKRERDDALAEVARLTGIMQHLPDVHATLKVFGESEPVCADWCYACRLARAEQAIKERDELRALVHQRSADHEAMGRYRAYMARIQTPWRRP